MYDFDNTSKIAESNAFRRNPLKISYINYFVKTKTVPFSAFDRILVVIPANPAVLFLITAK